MGVYSSHSANELSFSVAWVCLWPTVVYRFLIPQVEFVFIIRSELLTLPFRWGFRYQSNGSYRLYIQGAAIPEYREMKVHCPIREIFDLFPAGHYFVYMPASAGSMQDLRNWSKSGSGISPFAENPTIRYPGRKCRNKDSRWTPGKVRQRYSSDWPY